MSGKSQIVCDCLYTEIRLEIQDVSGNAIN